MGKLILILLTFYSSTFAQYNPGAREIALSNSDVALSNDVFALFNNPSGLAGLNRREIGIFYSPAPFGLKELANGYIAYSEPFDFGSISLGGSTFGFDLFRESKFITSISYKYLDKFFISVAANYHTINIQNYGNASSVYFNLGSLIKITENINWGFSFQNINRASFSSEESQIPIIYRSGLSYVAVDNLFSISASIEKEIDFDSNFSFGLEYTLFEYLTLRTGYSTFPSRLTAGIGINYNYFSLDYAVYTHQELGLTHQAGIILRFEK